MTALPVTLANGDCAGLAIGSLDGPQRTVLPVSTDWGAGIVAPGYLLYLPGPTLVAQAIDRESFALTDDPVVLAESVGRTATAYGAFSASTSGNVVYASRPRFRGELRWFSRVSADGGSEPRWRGDGEELFFLGSDMRVMSVAIPNGNALGAGPPRALFQTRVPLTGNPYRMNYAVSRDGQQFLVNTALDEGLS